MNLIYIMFLVAMLFLPVQAYGHNVNGTDCSHEGDPPSALDNRKNKNSHTFTDKSNDSDQAYCVDHSYSHRYSKLISYYHFILIFVIFVATAIFLLPRYGKI